MFPPKKQGMMGAMAGKVNTGPSNNSSMPGKGPFSAMPPAVPPQNTQSGNIQGFQGINTGPSGGFSSGPLGFLNPGSGMSPNMGSVMPMQKFGGMEGMQTDPNNFWQRYMQAMGGARSMF